MGAVVWEGPSLWDDTPIVLLASGYGRSSEDSQLPLESESMVRNKLLRLGTWGDPAMVPLDVWLPLITASRGRTGYTHQWRRHPEWMPYVMASCDTPEEVVEAESLGWRVFAAFQGERPKGLVPCPASAEQGHRLQCDSCLMCDGADHAGAHRSVFIQVHGPSKKKFQPERLGKEVPASAGTS